MDYLTQLKMVTSRKGSELRPHREVPEDAELSVEFLEFRIPYYYSESFWAESVPDTSFMFMICINYLVEHHGECAGVIHACRWTPESISRGLKTIGPPHGLTSEEDSLRRIAFDASGFTYAPAEICRIRDIINLYPKEEGYSVIHLNDFRIREFLVRDGSGEVFFVTDNDELAPYEYLRQEALTYYKGRL
ncbi:MAG: hypothetical protein ACYSR6_03945 [Planctomycetota bacterium]